MDNYMNLKRPWLYLFTGLSLIVLSACDNSSDTVQSNPGTGADADANTQAKPGPTLHIGQVYPNQHAVLQPILDNANKYYNWPTAMNIYPLYEPSSGDKAGLLHATLRDKVNDVYVPALESMPDKTSSSCKSENNFSSPHYQYLLNDPTQIQDYFSRGAADNCKKSDNATRYTVASKIPTSWPVIAVSDSVNLTLDFKNAGKTRPLLPVEKRDIAFYINDFENEFKKLYGKEYNGKTDKIKSITSLADARILLEAQYEKPGHSIRVSTWDHVTVANNIWRIFEISTLKDGKMIASREIFRYQGVLR